MTSASARYAAAFKFSFYKEKFMLWTIVIILLVLWLLGFSFAGAAVGNLIHILLVVALVVVIFQFIQGRRG